MTTAGRSPKILLVRLSALGDVIHALPALETLRRGLPDAEIHWLVDAGASPLLAHDPRIDRLVVARLKARGAGKLARAAAFLRLARELRAERYDVAIDLQGLLKSALLARATGAARIAGFRETREATGPLYAERHPRQGRHIAEMNAALVRAVFPGIPIRRESHLAVTAAARAFARDAYAPYGDAPRVVVNVGGGWPTKRYPPDLFRAAVERFLDLAGLPVAHILHGPGEKIDAVEAAGARGRILPENTVEQMLGLLEAADLVVSADSAPLHAAAALGRPCVGLFGPTDPVRNGAFAVRSAALVARVACRGCFRRACPRPPCMRTIPPDALAATMAGMILRNRGQGSEARGQGKNSLRS